MKQVRPHHEYTQVSKSYMDLLEEFFKQEIIKDLDKCIRTGKTIKRDL